MCDVTVDVGNVTWSDPKLLSTCMINPMLTSCAVHPVSSKQGVYCGITESRSKYVYNPGKLVITGTSLFSTNIICISKLLIILMCISDKE